MDEMLIGLKQSDPPSATRGCTGLLQVLLLLDRGPPDKSP